MTTTGDQGMPAGDRRLEADGVLAGFSTARLLTVRDLAEVLKVSQAWSVPSRMPTWNQYTRDPAEPWVHWSGFTWPCVRCWIQSSPTALASVSASLMSCCWSGSM
jgi:hypothetical protein